MAIYHLHISNGSKSAGASGATRSDYIQRENKYARDHEEVAYKESGNMPSWANQARDFWQAADTYERANARVYKEVEFALPRELDEKQRIELAREFVQELTDEHKLPYTMAIHHGKGHNPHCHVIVSTRGHDDLDRTPQTYFKRANSKEPELGGAPKVRDLNRKEWVGQVREQWESSANRKLEQAQSYERIDHRSYETRGVSLTPQVHIGVQAHGMLKRGVMTDRFEQWRDIQMLRAYEKEHQRIQNEILFTRADMEYQRVRGRDPLQEQLDRDIAKYEAQLERDRLVERERAEQLEREAETKELERLNNERRQAEARERERKREAQTVERHMLRQGFEKREPPQTMTDARIAGQTSQQAWVAWADGDQRCYAIVDNPRYFEAQAIERDGRANVAYTDKPGLELSKESNVVIKGHSIVPDYRQVEREVQALEQRLTHQREQRLAQEREQQLALEREQREREQANKQSLAQKLESLRERGIQADTLKPGRNVKGRVLPGELDLKEGKYLGIKYGYGDKVKLVPANDKLREFQRDEKEVRVKLERNGSLSIDEPELSQGRGM